MEMKYMSIYDIKSQKEMMEYLKKFSNEEKSLAYLIFGLTWNMCAKMVNVGEVKKNL